MPYGNSAVYLAADWLGAAGGAGAGSYRTDFCRWGCSCPISPTHSGSQPAMARCISPSGHAAARGPSLLTSPQSLLHRACRPRSAKLWRGTKPLLPCGWSQNSPPQDVHRNRRLPAQTQPLQQRLRQSQSKRKRKKSPPAVCPLAFRPALTPPCSC